jgi:hypothetical protein
LLNKVNELAADLSASTSAIQAAIDSMVDADSEKVFDSELALLSDDPYRPLRRILIDLKEDIAVLEDQASIDEKYLEAFRTLRLEEQLLREIRTLDPNHEFYYNVPVEASLAIELNENGESNNTLMNPAAYYDTNNVNNSFVISKLDIDYLTSGIKIARSSRLN